MTHEFVETANRFAPELRETVAEDNSLRRLSDRRWKILSDNGFLRSLRFVSAALLVGLCPVAIPAHSQQNAGGTPASTAVTTAEGWWSSDRCQTALAIPRLEVGLANLTRFETSELPPSSAAKEATYPSNEYVDELSHQVDFELTRDTRKPDISALAEGRLLIAGSFVSILSSPYEAWESSLSDSRSLTNVNGALAYPLIELRMLTGACRFVCTSHRFAAASRGDWRLRVGAKIGFAGPMVIFVARIRANRVICRTSFFNLQA